MSPPSWKTYSPTQKGKEALVNSSAISPFLRFPQAPASRAELSAIPRFTLGMRKAALAILLATAGSALCSGPAVSRPVFAPCWRRTATPVIPTPKWAVCNSIPVNTPSKAANPGSSSFRRPVEKPSGAGDFLYRSETQNAALRQTGRSRTSSSHDLDQRRRGLARRRKSSASAIHHHQRAARILGLPAGLCPEAACDQKHQVAANRYRPLYSRQARDQESQAGTARRSTHPDSPRLLRSRRPPADSRGSRRFRRRPVARRFR